MNATLTESTCTVLGFELNLPHLEESTLRFAQMLLARWQQQHPESYALWEAEGLDAAVLQEPRLAFQCLSAHAPEGEYWAAIAGYALAPHTLPPFHVTPTAEGRVYVPRVGFAKATSSEPQHVQYDADAQGWLLNGQGTEWTPEKVLPGGQRLYPHGPQGLLSAEGFTLRESVADTVAQHEQPLREAIQLMENEVPQLAAVIRQASPYLCLYNAENLDSFAHIDWQGAGFFNTYGKPQGRLFFMDDMAHQCGHVLYNMYTLEADRYLNHPKSTPLKELIDREWETRILYSAFHGLFTYTSILHCLHACVQNEAYRDADEELELYARMGFYCGKLLMDLEAMYNRNIFTAEGEVLFQQFVKGYQFIYQNYGPILEKFNYQGLPYVFSMEKFKEIN